MNYQDYAYNTKIQKISSAVLNGMSSGLDPFQEIIKEAQKENLTPHLVKAAVHNINNEIFLNHYSKNDDSKIQIIDPDEVIKALNIKEASTKKEKIASAAVDYWDIKPKIIQKTAGEIHVDPASKNRFEFVSKTLLLQKKAEDKKKKEDLYGNIVKKATHIQDSKKKLYDDALLSVRREYIPVEEVDFLYKTAKDADVKETLKLVIDKCGKLPQYDLTKKANLFDENDINYDSSILKKVNNIIAEKRELEQLIKEYKND